SAAAATPGSPAPPSGRWRGWWRPAWVRTSSWPTRCSTRPAWAPWWRPGPGPGGAGGDGLRGAHHVVFSPPEEGPLPQVGDQVRVLPAHVDPTVAYHERLYLVEGDRVLEAWPVDLRGC